MFIKTPSPSPTFESLLFNILGFFDRFCDIEFAHEIASKSGRYYFAGLIEKWIVKVDILSARWIVNAVVVAHVIFLSVLKVGIVFYVKIAIGEVA